MQTARTDLKTLHLGGERDLRLSRYCNVRGGGISVVAKIL